MQAGLGVDKWIVFSHGSYFSFIINQLKEIPSLCSGHCLGLIKCHSGHVQFEARRRWREVDTPAGRIPALLPPGGIGPEPRMDSVPALGEHSAALLAELGYSEADIARLRRERVI